HEPAGPDGQTLSMWRQQLRDVLRSSVLPNSGPSAADELPYDDAFARGLPAAWYVPASGTVPRLTWPSRAPAWPRQLLRTAALILAGLAGVWWGWRLGESAWPEQLALLGLAAW